MSSAGLAPGEMRAQDSSASRARRRSRSASARDLEPPEVDRHALAVPEELRERAGAEGGARASVLHRVLDALDAAGRGLKCCRLVVSMPSASPATGPISASATGCGDGIERLQRGADGFGPTGQVCRLRRLSLGSRRIFAVVAGHIEVGQVGERVPAMQLGDVPKEVEALLECVEMALVVEVANRSSRPVGPSLARAACTPLGDRSMTTPS